MNLSPYDVGKSVDGFALAKGFIKGLYNDISNSTEAYEPDYRRAAAINGLSVLICGRSDTLKLSWQSPKTHWTTNPNFPILPLHVCEIIMDTLASDKGLISVKKCSVISKSFLPLCRKHIFATIKRTPAIGNYIRHLQLNFVDFDDLHDVGISGGCASVRNAPLLMCYAAYLKL